MATSAMHVPRYVVLDFDGDTIEADDSLAVVLDALRQDHDPDAGEELVVWRDAEVIVAVVKRDGRIVHMEPDAEPAPDSKPANGKARRRR